jgi:hypothetical protein
MSLKEKTLLILNPEIIQETYNLNNEKSIIVTSIAQFLCEIIIDTALENLKSDPDYDFDESKILSQRIMKASFKELFKIKEFEYDDLESTTLKKLNIFNLLHIIDSDIKLTKNSKTLFDMFVCHFISSLLEYFDQNNNGDVLEDLSKILKPTNEDLSDIIKQNVKINLDNYHKNLHNDLKSLSAKKKKIIS